MQRKILLAAAACALFLCVNPEGARAQLFSAATVRPAIPGTAPVAPRFSEGRWRGTAASLRDYICAAFGVSDFQVAGPEWLATDLFDLDAALPAGSEDQTPELVLQSLLAERFELQTRRDTRLVSVYDLRVPEAGNSPKAASGNGPEAIDVLPGRLNLRHVSMARLAQLLSREMKIPVVNRTQLQGVYDFTLQWTAETPLADVERQLNLKLQPNRAQIGLLVVDSATPPQAPR